MRRHPPPREGRAACAALIGSNRPSAGGQLLLADNLRLFTHIDLTNPTSRRYAHDPGLASTGSGRQAAGGLRRATEGGLSYAGRLQATA